MQSGWREIWPAGHTAVTGEAFYHAESSYYYSLFVRLKAIAREILLPGKLTISNWILSGHFKFSCNEKKSKKFCVRMFLKCAEENISAESLVCCIMRSS